MAAAPGDKAATKPSSANLTRAVSLEPPRSRSDSMEELDSSLRNKRPRLDNGDRSNSNFVRSLSADPVAAASQLGPSTSSSALLPQGSTSADPKSSTISAQLPSDQKKMEKEKPLLHRSSSKVTINTKSPISASSAPADSSNHALGNPTDSQPQPELEPSPSHDHSSLPPAPPSDTTMRMSAPTPISVSSSPTQSPEIEVAELEDMDQDPSETIWPSASVNHIVAEFPNPFALTDVSRVLDQARRAIRGGEAEAMILASLKDWVTKAARLTPQALKQSLVRDRAFWEEFPYKIMTDLLQRSSPFSDSFDSWLVEAQGNSHLDYFEELLTSFAILTLNIVGLEEQVLKTLPNDTEDALDLLSPHYIPLLEDCLCYREECSCPVPPLYSLLYRGYTENFAWMAQCVTNNICTVEIDCITRLTSFSEQLWRVNSKPDRFPLTCLVRVCGVMNNLLQSRYLVDFEDMNVLQVDAPDDFFSRTKLFYDFVRLMDTCHEDLIVKLNPSLTAELNKHILENMAGSILIIGETNLKVLNHMTDRFQIDTTGLNNMDQAVIVKHAWMFHRLHKCITKARMELRAQAVDIMQDKLVNVYHFHIKMTTPSQRCSHPLVRYLVNFIRDVKIIDYVIGVDSHPQLMSRSANIIGFLLVTHEYRDEDTDKLWRVIMQSEDHRAVSAMLQMLDSFCRTADPEPLQYLTSKLQDVPMRRFDKEFTGFVDNLMKHIMHKYHDRQTWPDILHHKVCIRLIHDSISTPDLDIDRKLHVQDLMRHHLDLLMRWPILDEDKLDIYRQCVQDIKDKNRRASSSLRVLNWLLTPSGKLMDDISCLTSQFDFTRVFVDELSQFVLMHPDTLTNSHLSLDCFVDRIDLLDRIISEVPETLAGELGRTVWDTLYAAQTLPKEAQVLVWDRLIYAIRLNLSKHRRNPFLSSCMTDYLPKLDPHAFDAHVLCFAMESIKYDIQLDPPPPPQEGETVTIPSVERLWNFLINVPSAAIAKNASDYLVELYLDSTLIRTAPRSASEATHVKSVDDCIARLTAAAAKLKSFSDGTMSGEDEPMVIVATETETRAEELRFSRSLLFLKEFLQGLRRRPQYCLFGVQDRQPRGEIVELLYECYDGPIRKPRQTLRIGDLQTVRELRERLIEGSGFSNPQVICGALGRIDFATNPLQTIRDRKLDKAGLLLVRNAAVEQSQGVKSVLPGRLHSLRLVDSEILKHFDQLYDLLDLEDKFSKEIHDFLIVFPPQARLRDLVQNQTLSDAQIFPLDKPYKTLFSIYAMSRILAEQSNKSSIDEPFVFHCLHTLSALLIRPDDSDNGSKTIDRMAITLKTVDVLTMAFRLSIRRSLKIAIPSPASFIDRLASLINRGAAQMPEARDTESAAFISGCLTCVLYASIQDPQTWGVCRETVDFHEMLLAVLIHENRYRVRLAVTEVVMNLSDLLPQIGTLSPDDVLSHTMQEVIRTLWAGVASIIPTISNSQHWRLNSEAFFQVALTLMECMMGSGPFDDQLSTYMKAWTDTLFCYEPFQFVGRNSVDPIVNGLVHMINNVLHHCKRDLLKLDLSNFRDELVGHFLFPGLSEDSPQMPIQAVVPIMNPSTRMAMYNTLALLVNDRESYFQTLGHFEDLIPKDFAYERTWEEDRTRILRSECGYAGLRNLSNTCYVNSLFAQLFMNVSFREFILQAKVTDVNEQRLLFETQKVFSYMQQSWLKSVDTAELAESIITYEMEPIDVTIQMDVGEFFALLFHRLESQIVDSDDQATFRNFYGGQLVQQIKSKECTHISEKIEPFNSIQCEIKGKANLEESLKAYVEGEVMQGDNKYSCTSCGRHVDAVKRACLKDIPDHLIIQLKRFDFDLNILQRNKVNDEFRFPMSLDMSPYKVETLNKDGGGAPPDLFELVGILVHSGSAETGHYYSYIQQTPVGAGVEAPWIEFNDIDVVPWDPACVADGCFGGWTESPFPPGLRFQKSWNAYMLFYQRVSDIATSRKRYEPREDYPVQVKLPLNLGNHIALCNELVARGYLLQERDHAKFIAYLLGRMRWGPDDSCSAEHQIETKAIYCALDHIEQVIVKTEDQPHFEEIMFTLEGIVRSCGECATAAIDWNTENPDAFRNVLMRNKKERIRQRFSSLFLQALGTINGPRVPVLNENGIHIVDGGRLNFHLHFDNLAANLSRVWLSLSLNIQAWDDYFRLVVRLTQFGDDAIGVVLDEGFLRKCIELILMDEPRVKRSKPFGNMYARLAERKKKLSYGQVLELTKVLLENVDLTYGLVAFDETVRDRVADGKWQLQRLEDNLLRLRGPQHQLLLVERLVQHHWPLEPVKHILNTLLLAEDTWGEGDSMVEALIQAMKVDPACDAKNALEAAVLFCTYCSSGHLVKQLVRESLRLIDSICNSGGREHIDFIKALRNVRNERCADVTPLFIRRNIRHKMPDWAPTLLAYQVDASVRTSASELVNDLLNSNDVDFEEGNRHSHIAQVGRALAGSCIDKVDHLWITPRATPYKAHIEEIVLVMSECCRRFYDRNDVDDVDFIRRAQQTVEELHRLSVDVAEDLTIHDSETILDPTSQSEFDDGKMNLGF